MPLVNPGGMSRGTRANPAGVDLMRNAPVRGAATACPRWSAASASAPACPGTAARAGAPMEPESAAAVRRGRSANCMGRPFSLALDCHSGFGLRDRLWFPVSPTRAQPIAHLPELHALHEIFERSHPHHPYVFEPQSRQYLAHGDLWDHLYLRALARGAGVFLPLTLEMGSWLWVKKNPRQLFSRARHLQPADRAPRSSACCARHLPLLDFVVRAAAGHALWLPPARRARARTARGAPGALVPGDR